MTVYFLGPNFEIYQLGVGMVAPALAPGELHHQGEGCGDAQRDELAGPQAE